MGNGGAQKLTAELCNEIVKEHEVCLCPFRAVESWMHFPKMLDKRVLVESLNKRETGFDASVFPKLHSLISDFSPDVVHIQATPVMKYLLPFVFLFSDVKFVYTIHTKRNSSNSILFSKGLLRGVRQRIKSVCISQNIFNDFSLSFPKSSFHLVENGLKEMIISNHMPKVTDVVAAFKKDNETQVAISVGDVFKSVKNYKMLIESFSKLKNENIISIVIGSLDNIDPVIKQYIDNEEDKNVFFVGAHFNIADFMKCSNLMLLSSLKEGMPLVALEAMNMGLPIVSTPAGGMVDIVKQGINGFITTDFTSGSFVSAIKQYLALTDVQKMRISENNNAEFREKYSIANCAHKYTEIYKS